MRTRILVVLGSTLTVMMAVILVLTQTGFARAYDRMESSLMTAHIQRVRNALERDLMYLGATCNDWANWDLTYDFVQTADPAYIADNLTRGTLSNLDLDLMVFHAAGRGVVHLEYVGEPPADLNRFHDLYPQLLGTPESPSRQAGILALDREPWLMVSRPILDTAGKAEPRGTLVLGRKLSTLRIERLGQSVQLGLELAPPIGPGAPPQATGLSADRPVVVELRGRDHLAAYTNLDDVRGVPVATLIVQAESDIRRRALRSTEASVVAIILAGVAFIATALVFLERRVLSRLHALSAQVLAIKTGEMSGQRLVMQGDDQIAYLAAAINGMLAEIDGSRRRTTSFLEAVPDLILLVNPDDTVRDMRVPDGLLPQPMVDPRERPLAAVVADLGLMDVEVRDRLYTAIRSARESQTPGFLAAELTVGGRRLAYEIRISATATLEAVVVARDVTAKRAAEAAERKDLLIRETHHRVRNNLQVISSLLALQAKASTDPDTRVMLEESLDRVRSMALIHERLSLAQDERGLGFAAYLHDLVEHLGRSYGDAGRIRIEMMLDDVTVPEQAALPTGLVVNELLTNSLRHAFPDGRKGRVCVGLQKTPTGGVSIRVQDDGIGLPEWVDTERPFTLGLRIVRALVEQMGASLRIDRGAGSRFWLHLDEAAP